MNDFFGTPVFLMPLGYSTATSDWSLTLITLSESDWLIRSDFDFYCNSSRNWFWFLLPHQKVAVEFPSGSRKTANPRSFHRTVLLVWYWSILSVNLTGKSVQNRFGDWRDMDTATSMISGITKNIVDGVLRTWLPLNLEFSKSGKISAEQQSSFSLFVLYNRTDTTTGALGMKHGATLFYSSGLHKTTLHV